MSEQPANQQPSGMLLHMGVAEQGKLYALAGDHRRALFYYRQAMHMTVEAGDPEIFFRHYLECVIDSLEQMQGYGEVLEYCERAIKLYQANPPTNPMATMDLANIYQRKGVNLLKMGDDAQATEALQQALQVAGSLGKLTPKTLPLAQLLITWLRSRFHIDHQRLLAEQKRLQYFIVRKDTVDGSKAVKLPDESLLGV